MSVQQTNDKWERWRQAKAELIKAMGEHPTVDDDTHPRWIETYKEFGIEFIDKRSQAQPAGELEDQEDLDWATEKPRVLEALKFIPPDCDRDTWIRIGMALHHATGGSREGFRIYDDWSAPAGPPKYDRKRLGIDWRSFKYDGDPKNLVKLGSLYRLAKDNGWQETAPQAPKTEDLTYSVYFDVPINDDETPIAALNGMHRSFEANKAKGSEHDPSDEQWAGLKQIIKTIEAMACRLQDAPENERVKGWSNNFYASFLDCGVGKTAALIETIKAILTIPKYEHVAFIVFLSRLEEIKTLVERMGLDNDTFAVITSHDEYNALGNPQKKKARVLFTTQKMLERKSKLHELSFTQMVDFYYKGKPRQVRIWDEAILPSVTFTLERRKTLKIIHDLYQLSPELGNAVDAFANKTLPEAKDGETIEMPMFSRYGISMQDARQAVHEDDADTVEAIFTSEGCVVRISKDKEGTTTIHYEDFLPDDLRPMLILDASGRQRKTYDFWAKHRLGLETLYSPKKDYTPLTIHHWNEGAGKRAQQQRKKDKLVAEGIAKKINELPGDEECLVIYFKKVQSVPDAIRKLVSSPDRVKFLHYGKHTATNDFSHIRHVFLAGILQYNTAQYVATALAAKGAKIDHKLTAEELLSIRYGEIAHHILQAACRGKVRNCVGNTCPPDCHLYIIFPTYKGTGIPQDLLTEIFPGATIEDWRPIVNVKGKALDLLDALTKTKPGTVITKAGLLQRLQIKGPNLSPLLKNDDLLAKLKEKGLRLIVSRATVQLLPIPETRSPGSSRSSRYRPANPEPQHRDLPY